jgi:thiol-disulfide isomerase/thioredoxin
MGTFFGIAAGIGVAFVVLMAGMQVFVRVKAASMKGKPLPEIPGPLGRQLSRARKGLVYFFSPQCGACRAITPKMKELSHKFPSSVVLVDVTQQMDVARALSVMATPSVVEVAEGKVVGYHVGPVPNEVWARFA